MVRGHVQGVAIADVRNAIAEDIREAIRAVAPVVQADESRPAELGIPEHALVEIADPDPSVRRGLDVLDAVTGGKRAEVTARSVVDVGVSIPIIIGPAPDQEPLT